MTNLSIRYRHTHTRLSLGQSRIVGRRGAFSLGMLSASVKGGESAKYRIAFDPGLSNEEIRDLQRVIWSANRVKQLMESSKFKWGYSNTVEPEVDEVESWNFDEALKTDVWVEVFFAGSCGECETEAHSLKNLGENIGVVTLVDVEGLGGKLGKNWILPDWPHVSVSGREVSAAKLGQLVADARYIRALEARKRSEESV